MINILLNSLLLVSSMALAFGIMMMIRNNWVYKARTKILNNHNDSLSSLRNSLSEYNRLPSYDYMMWHFWIWDVSKFMKDRK